MSLKLIDAAINPKHDSYAPFCVLYSKISASCPGVKCLKYVQFSSVEREQMQFMCADRFLRKTEVTRRMCSRRGAAMQQQVHKCLYAVYLWTLNEIFICFPSVLLDITDQTTAGVSCSACLFHPSLHHLTRFRLHQSSCNCPPNGDIT